MHRKSCFYPHYQPSEGPGFSAAWVSDYAVRHALEMGRPIDIHIDVNQETWKKPTLGFLIRLSDETFTTVNIPL